ncbi:MAG: hypothetical protein ACK501_19285, partial [Planctomycetota bacterium]
MFLLSFLFGKGKRFGKVVPTAGLCLRRGLGRRRCGVLQLGELLLELAHAIGAPVARLAAERQRLGDAAVDLVVRGLLVEAIGAAALLLLLQRAFLVRQVSARHAQLVLDRADLGLASLLLVDRCDLDAIGLVTAFGQLSLDASGGAFGVLGTSFGSVRGVRQALAFGPVRARRSFLLLGLEREGVRLAAQLRDRIASVAGAHGHDFGGAQFGEQLGVALEVAFVLAQLAHRLEQLLVAHLRFLAGGEGLGGLPVGRRCGGGHSAANGGDAGADGLKDAHAVSVGSGCAVGGSVVEGGCVVASTCPLSRSMTWSFSAARISISSAFRIRAAASRRRFLEV